MEDFPSTVIRQRRPTIIFHPASETGDHETDTDGVSVHSSDWFTGSDTQSEMGFEERPRGSKGKAGSSAQVLLDEQEEKNEPVLDEKQCRICFGGVEEEAEMGKLIRPCRCRGSMRYVHVECLNQWRKASASRQSFWACDQCKYTYALARTKVVGLATSPAVLATTTLMIFLIIVFVSSFFVSYFVPDLDPSSTSVYFDSLVERGNADAYWDTLSHTNAASDLLRLAVYAINDLGVNEDDGSFVWDPVKTKKVPKGGDKHTAEGSSKRGANGRSKQASEKKPYERPAGSTKKNGKVKGDGTTEELLPEEEVTGNSTPLLTSVLISILSFRDRLLIRLIHRFTVGTAFVGILSFISLLFNLALLSPLQLMRRGRGWFASRRGDDRSNGNLGTMLIVLFVAIGVARAIYKVYQLNRALAKAFLARAETAILEVGEADDDENMVPQTWKSHLDVWKNGITLSIGRFKGHIILLFSDPNESFLSKLQRWIQMGVGAVSRFAIELWHGAPG